MNYEPHARPARGIDPMLSNRLTGRCDICGKSRPHYNHDKCSKARQVAGFKIVKGPAPDSKVTCVQCHRVYRYDAMMGNTCRDCYAAQLKQAIGLEVSNG